MCPSSAFPQVGMALSPTRSQARAKLSGPLRGTSAWGPTSQSYAAARSTGSTGGHGLPRANSWNSPSAVAGSTLLPAGSVGAGGVGILGGSGAEVAASLPEPGPVEPSGSTTSIAVSGLEGGMGEPSVPVGADWCIDSDDPRCSPIGGDDGVVHWPRSLRGAAPVALPLWACCGRSGVLIRGAHAARLVGGHALEGFAPGIQRPPA